MGVAIALLAVLVAAVWGGWTWSQQQYYVGEQDGMVTIYRGLSQDLGPIALSSTQEQTDVAVEALPPYYRDQVRRTLSADDLPGAERLVADLRALAKGSCVPTVVLPDGTTATEVPDDAAVVTAGSLAEARAQQTSTPARPTGADDTAATTRPATAPGTSSTTTPSAAAPTSLVELLERALALGSGPVGSDGDLATASAPATGTAYPTPTPTVTIVWPEGCP